MVLDAIFNNISVTSWRVQLKSLLNSRIPIYTKYSIAKLNIVYMYYAYIDLILSLFIEVPVSSIANEQSGIGICLLGVSRLCLF